MWFIETIATHASNNMVVINSLTLAEFTTIIFSVCLEFLKLELRSPGERGGDLLQTVVYSWTGFAWLGWCIVSGNRLTIDNWHTQAPLVAVHSKVYSVC